MGFHKPLIRPYFWGGYVRGGGWLNSHNEYVFFLFFSAVRWPDTLAMLRA